MLLVDNEDEDRTLSFLFLHLLFEDHLATFQFLVKHFDQPWISSLSIGCYQGSFQQSAKHIQNLPSRDSMKLCCVFCKKVERRKTLNTNAFYQLLSKTYFLILWFTALSNAKIKYASNENMFQDGTFCSLQVQLKNKKDPKVCFLLLQGSN